jgi:hypothetical protein
VGRRQFAGEIGVGEHLVNVRAEDLAAVVWHPSGAYSLAPSGTFSKYQAGWVGSGSSLPGGAEAAID